MASPRAQVTSRAARGLRDSGALVWLGLAWLAGPVPGFDARGVTGQPTGELWWWHLAAAGLVVWALVGGLRTGELGDRIDAATTGAWRPGRRWRTVVVTGWLVLVVVAAAQLGDGRASWGDVVTFTAAATIAGLAPRRSVGGEAVPRLALGGLVLALFAAATFAGASELFGQDFAFYRVKQAVVAPVARHNVLAGFLLALVPAVALAAVRRPRWWWPALVVAGLGLGATLSRAALVAGIGAIAVAAFLRDRTVARRLGVVVALAGVVVTVVLLQVGARIPTTEAVADDPTSVVARTQLWSAGWDAFTDAPFGGVGLDGFLAESRDAGVAAPHEHAHNLLLHAAATTGTPGLLAVVAVWGGLLAGARQLLDRARSHALLVGLGGLGAMALVDELALRPGTTGLLALLVVAAAAPRDPAAAAA